MSIFLADELATVQQAERLAARLKGGDCITLSGSLGAGKSFFARALMRALGVRDHAIPSPSFSLIEEYDADYGLRIAHMDWYRLHDSEEVMMLGVQEYFQPPWITLIEWAERAESLLPFQHKKITLLADPHTPSGRWFTLEE